MPEAPARDSTGVDRDWHFDSSGALYPTILGQSGLLHFRWQQKAAGMSIPTRISIDAVRSVI